MIIICNHYSNFQAGTLDNVTKTIGRLLDGYDIRLRPNFGGEALSSLSKLYFHRPSLAFSPELDFAVCLWRG